MRTGKLGGGQRQDADSSRTSYPQPLGPVASISPKPDPQLASYAAPNQQVSGSWRQFTGGMRVVGNSLAIFIAQIINKLSTFAAFYIVSITLPLRELGLYTLVLALRELASVIATFGIDDVLVRILSQAGGATIHKRLLRDAVILKLIGGVLACASMVAVAAALQTDQELLFGAAIAGGDLILVAVTASLVGYYRSRLRSSALTGVQAATSALYLAMLGAGVGIGASWLELLEILLLSDAVLCVAVAVKLGDRLGAVRLDAATHKRELFLGAIPLGLASIAILAYTRLDTLLIAQLRGPAEVALYSVSYKITEAPLILVTSIAATTLPVVSVWSAVTYRSARVTDAAQRAMRYSYAIALPIAVGVSFFGRELIALLYGPAFAGVVPAITILIWAMVAMASNITSGAILTAIGKAHLLIGISLVNLAVNIALNLWAIPQWGYFGSAAATTATEGLNAAIQITILCVVLRRARLAVGFGLALVLGAATLAALFIPGLRLSTVAEVGILCAMPILLAACRLVTLDDLRRLMRSVKRAPGQVHAEANQVILSAKRTFAPNHAPQQARGRAAK